MTRSSRRTLATSSRLTSANCILFAVVFVLQSLHAAYAYNGGRVYALGFFNLTSTWSGTKTPVFEEVAISCYQCNTLVKISIPLLNVTKLITLSTTGSTTYKYNINQDIATATTFPASFTWPSIGVIITSNSSPIAVHVNKALPGSSAAYLARPLYYYANGTNTFNYFIASYSGGSSSAVSIVAAYNDTCVEIYRRGLPVIDLQMQQAFTLQSGDVFNMYSTTADFTNWIVMSRKPVAVYGGVDYTRIPNGVDNYDAIMEQIPGATKLGGLYTLTSIPGRPYSVGFQMRVINAYDTSLSNGATIIEVVFDSTLTVPTIVRNTHVTLTSGQFLEYTIGRGRNNFTLVVVMADNIGTSAYRNTIEVAQYNVGDAVPPTSSTIHSDPSMVVWPCADDGGYNAALGRQCYTQNIVFSTLSLNDGTGPVPAQNYMTVLAYDGDQTGTLTSRLLLDGKRINQAPGFTGWINVGQASGVTTLEAGAYFSYHYVTTVGPISEGFHTLTSDQPDPYDAYNAVIFGHGSSATYPMSNAYVAGWDNYQANSQGVPGVIEILTGSLNDFSDPQAAITTSPASATTAPMTTGPQALDQLPTFGIVWVANFTTLPTDPNSKTSHRECANLYGKEFVFVIAKYLSTSISNNINGLIGCSSGAAVQVNVADANTAYYSQYTTTGGSWNMTITGSGQATLADIYACAQNVILYTKNLANWRPSYDSKAKNMLQLNDPNFAKNFSALDVCPELYVSNLDGNGFLPVRSQSWLCTSQNSAVVSTSGSPPSASLLGQRSKVERRAALAALLASIVFFNRWR